MKKRNIIIISTILAISTIFIVAFFVEKNNTISPNDEEILQPDVTPPVVSEKYEITTLNLTEDTLDDDGNLLITSEILLPNSAKEDDEFSTNFNDYYKNVHSKGSLFINSEFYDLALGEKQALNADYSPVSYNSSYQIMFKDDNLISIKRTILIVSNETEQSYDFYETFSAKDGTLVLVTDIYPQAVESFEQTTTISVSSIEDFKFYLDDDGIILIYEDTIQTLLYNSIDLTENYTYLGENNATN